MTKEMEEAIKNADNTALINELMRGYSFGLPGVGSCHPYNELKEGKSSPALEWLKSHEPETYKVFADLVAKDKAVEEATPHPKVCLHHIKARSKYIVKKAFNNHAAFMYFDVGKELEITEIDLDKHVIKFIYRGVTPTYTMSFVEFCELTESGAIEQKEK